MHGDKSDKTNPAHMLPPCKVCGEPGTGFHYGVTTCGACKGFFRRSIIRQDPYECVHSRLCRLGPSINRRQSCPKCRYDKCIAVGMSREACKVGRYTLIKRYKGAEEALEYQQSSQLTQLPYVPDATTGEEERDTSKATNDICSVANSLLDVSMRQMSPVSTPDGSFTLDQQSTEAGPGIALPVDNESICNEEQFDTCSSQTDENASLPGDLDAECPRYENTSLLAWDNNSSPMSRSVHGSVGIETSVDKAFNTNHHCELDTSSFPISSSYAVLESSCYSYSNTTSPWITLNSTSPYASPAMSSALPVDGWNCSPLNRSQEDLITTLNATAPNSFQSTSTQNPFCPTLSRAVPDLHPHFNMVDDTPFVYSSSSPNLDFHSKALNVPQDSKSTIFSSPAQSTTDGNISPQCVTSPHFLRTVRTGNVQSSHQYSPDGSNFSFESNDLIDYEGLPVSNDSSPAPKKRREEADYEGQSTAKRQRLLQVTKTNFPRDTNSLPLALKENNFHEHKPLTLYIVAPDPMKYTLSIFDRFPFNSFEKQSLSPLLKMCYDSHDWLDDYLCQPSSEHSRIWSKDYQPIEPSRALSCQMTARSAQEMTYDTVEMDDLYDYLEYAHTKHYGPESAFLTASEKKMYLEMLLKICQLHDSLKGKLDLIDDDKYFQILESTGVDVDKRQEWFRCTFSGFDDSFARDARFFRSLPGLRQLSLHDRMILIKATFPFVLSLRHNDTTDFVNDICIDQERGSATRLSTFRRMFPGFAEFNVEWRESSTELKNLELSFEEIIILKALFIVVPDIIQGLENTKLVKEWHNTYLKCLLHRMRKRLGQEAADERFNQFINIIDKLKATCANRLSRSLTSVSDCIKKLSDGKDGNGLLFLEVLEYWKRIKTAGESQ